jgi:Tfp pilus assembly protein PilX
MVLIQPLKTRSIRNICSFSPIRAFLGRLRGNLMADYSRNNNIFEKIFSFSLDGTPLYQNENGMATAVALLLVTVLTLLGTTAVVMTSTDIQIGGNYKVSEVTFYAAEAGVEEARARLRSTAGANLIADTSPTSTQWRAYIGTLAMAQKGNERCLGCVGFNSSLATHSRTNSLSGMNYVVEIKHKTDAAGNIMYWGDHDSNGTITRNTSAGNSNNRNIYLVTSSGYTANSHRTVEAEMAKMPPISVPSPLYVKANSTIQGSSTHIIGNDACGSSDKHAVITTKDPGSVNYEHGHPTIIGVGGTDPDIVYNGPNMDITAMVNSLKTAANFSYNVVSSGNNTVTHTGMNWGTPTPGATQQDPSTCSVHNIVYYNTNGTDIKLAGGSSGCGVLLIEGDLEVNGGFSWHGVIVVTGSVRYAGGGNKQVTGGILSGGTVEADLITGNANIVYCSSAVNSATENVPARMLSWRDLRQGT